LRRNANLKIKIVLFITVENEVDKGSVFTVRPHLQEASAGECGSGRQTFEIRL
jgi:hypothetical protein